MGQIDPVVWLLLGSSVVLSPVTVMDVEEELVGRAGGRRLPDEYVVVSVFVVVGDVEDVDVGWDTADVEVVTNTVECTVTVTVETNAPVPYQQLYIHIHKRNWGESSRKLVETYSRH